MLTHVCSIGSIDAMGPVGPMPTGALAPVYAPLYRSVDEHDACGVGFVADLDGRHAHSIVPLALDALAALAHRGARAADDATGDGAGISIPITPGLRRRVLHEAGVQLAPRRRVAIGMCFFPSAAVAEATELVVRAADVAGLAVAGWRDVPVETSLTAGRRIAGTPIVRQAVVVAMRRMGEPAFERALALLRRHAEADAAERPGLDGFAVASLSARTVVYKGLFVGDELGRYYADLRADDLQARYAMFHQRYSTNTFPSWALAQPFAFLAHNGEINTIRANREAMRGRRRALGGARWARRIAEVAPLVSVEGSDSRSLDDAVELLLLAGVQIDDALAMLVPAAAGLGGVSETLPTRVEPWDGPAALAFADGRRIGARLDRNGLRPLALAATDDGLVAVASEAGAVPLDSRRVVRRDRLGPGSMVVADVHTGSLCVTEGAPDLAAVPLRVGGIGHGRQRDATRTDGTDVRTRIALGLDAEIVRQHIRPMAIEGHEAIWSMGDDTPIAPLATRRRRASGYLRQAFAQVTNPALDPERERVVMSLAMAVGRQPRLLHGDGANVVRLDGPVLDAAGWDDLVHAFEPASVVTLDATWSRASGRRGLVGTLNRLARQARAAASRRAALVVVSDRLAADPRRVAVPSVLAVGRVHQALTDVGLRSSTDVVADAGDAFDVHDAAMLIAAGASAVHPRVLLEVAAEQAGTRGAEGLDPDVAVRHTVEALEAGLRKVLARMGISTLASYRGGQLFDALGLDPAVVAACFPAANAWPGSVGLSQIAGDALDRHRAVHDASNPSLEDPGLVRFRGSGERHAFAPRIVKALQTMAAGGAPLGDRLDTYRQAIDDGGVDQPRHLLMLRPAGPPLPLDAVEPAADIARRFVSSAMSLGALSPEAHQAISIGMARLGGSSNSGEGGEDPAWYADDGPDRRDAAIKQVASARFGVTTEYLARAEQIEIKIAQGSKPGEGGQLPGRKATAFIAALRRGQPGMTMISPPPHHDIYSIEDLAQLIGDLRAVNPDARIGVKLVAGGGIGTIAAGVAKAHADYILVAGHAGGTGASPLSSIKHVGLPWELGLAEVHQVLLRNRLRDRIALRTDGGLRTGRDVVMAAALGAEEFGFGTAVLVAIGCDMARQCHLDTCPTGIATQREDLRAKFAGSPEQVVAFLTAIAEDVRRELASLGLRTLGQLVGRCDLLETAASTLALESMTNGPAWPMTPERTTPPKDRGRLARPPADACFEATVAADACARTDAGEAVEIRSPVTSKDRSIGARLAGLLARRREPRMPPRVRYELHGSAGQSLGAFAVAGMRIVVEGEANDYVGKGLSGGTVIVRPDASAGIGAASSPALVGNVCLYGATAGSLHVVGRAGMRFAVRNAGAHAVVEGVGAHACEYMTGGAVVVLGPVGPNFGAGMTGGRAFLVDDVADGMLNSASVAAHSLAADDEGLLRKLVEAHAIEGSATAAALLRDWDPRRFIVVRPISAIVTDDSVPAEPLKLAR